MFEIWASLLNSERRKKVLRPRRRLTKREIKEDKFITYTLMAFNVFRHNVRYVLGAVAVVLVIALAASIFYSISKSREAKASELMADAQISLFSGNTCLCFIETFLHLKESFPCITGLSQETSRG